MNRKPASSTVKNKLQLIKKMNSALSVPEDIQFKSKQAERTFKRILKSRAPDQWLEYDMEKAARIAKAESIINDLLDSIGDGAPVLSVTVQLNNLVKSVKVWRTELGLNTQARDRRTTKKEALDCAEIEKKKLNSSSNFL